MFLIKRSQTIQELAILTSAPSVYRQQLKLEFAVDASFIGMRNMWPQRPGTVMQNVTSQDTQSPLVDALLTLYTGGYQPVALRTVSNHWHWCLINMAVEQLQKGDLVERQNLPWCLTWDFVLNNFCHKWSTWLPTHIWAPVLHVACLDRTSSHVARVSAHGCRDPGKSVWAENYVELASLITTELSSFG